MTSLYYWANNVKRCYLWQYKGGRKKVCRSSVCVVTEARNGRAGPKIHKGPQGAWIASVIKEEWSWVLSVQNLLQRSSEQNNATGTRLDTDT